MGARQGGSFLFDPATGERRRIDVDPTEIRGIQGTVVIDEFAHFENPPAADPVPPADEPPAIDAARPTRKKGA